MKKTIKHIILGLALAMSTPALAQNKVSGTVIDENGDPIIGATVTVVGTKTSTETIPLTSPRAARCPSHTSATSHRLCSQVAKYN